MKRVAVHVTTGLLTFTGGLAAASCWNMNKDTVTTEQRVSILERCPTNKNDSSASTVIPSPTATSDREVVFGRPRLRIVPNEVRLNSESLRYEIVLTYPQVVGKENSQIRRLNRHMKNRATAQSIWALNPSKEDLQMILRC